MPATDVLPEGTHERLIQSLSAMLIQLNALQTLLPAEAATIAIDTNVLREGLTTLDQEMRELLHTIRSADEEALLPELTDTTLAEALSRAVEETAETLGLSSRITLSGEEHPLSPGEERLLYCVAREALFQVHTHANAHRLRLVLTYARDEVQMSIEDDGLAPTTEEETPAPPFTFSPVPTATVLDDLRRHLERLGGTLEVSAQQEQGTRVQARIPYVSHVEAPPLLPSVVQPAAERISMLVVEGQAVTRAGLRRLLESYPDLQVVGEAADGVQGASEALELGPQVVLLDMQLPNGQSLDALRQMKQLNPDTRVLVISAQNREEYLYEALRAGADGYILKDIAPDELARAVRAVARGEVLVQPQLASQLLSRFGRQSRGSYQDNLTAREQEVLRLLARGLRNKEIASRLSVSERTVNFHLANIYQKLNVSGRTEALSKAIEQGLVNA